MAASPGDLQEREPKSGAVGLSGHHLGASSHVPVYVKFRMGWINSSVYSILSTVLAITVIAITAISY